MKSKQTIFKVFLFVLTGILASCSSSSTDDGGSSNETTSISISSNATSIFLGDSFAFTVVDNLGNDVSAQSTIYFNGSDIGGTNYTPTQEGTFSAYAKYGNLTSGNINLTIEVEEELSSLVISSSKSAMKIGEGLTLTAVGNEGSNFTSQATFYANGIELEGNSYTGDSFGNVVFTATYESFESNEATVLVGHTNKVLIEDYTGAWCGWCPRVAYGIELVENQTDDAVVVAIHRGNSSGSSYDPFNYPASDLENFIGLSGYPTAMINRTVEWNYPEPNNVNQVVGNTYGIGSTGLALSSSLTGSTLSVHVDINAINGLNSNSKLVVYVLEDGLIEDQTNYTDYYGGGAILYDFEHNHVLRQVPTGLFGETISSTDIDNATGYYSKEYNFELSSSISNNNNLTVVAFVVNASGKAIQSQKAAVGETKDFD